MPVDGYRKIVGASFGHVDSQRAAFCEEEVIPIFAFGAFAGI
jgi:hypothetical protein